MRAEIRTKFARGLGSGVWGAVSQNRFCVRALMGVGVRAAGVADGQHLGGAEWLQVWKIISQMGLALE